MKKRRREREPSTDEHTAFERDDEGEKMDKEEEREQRGWQQLRFGLWGCCWWWLQLQQWLWPNEMTF